MNAQVLVRATGLTLLLFVSGPSFAETCGSVIHEDSFEIPIISTYNDVSISGATDDGMNFTRIESTGLDWLDLTVTFNLSVNTINQRLADPSDDLYGLRYATAEELQYYLLLLVYQLRAVDEVAGVETGIDFIENFGQGISVNGVHIVIGFYPTTNGGYIQNSVVYDCLQNKTITALGGLDSNEKSEFAGSFLVRAIP